MHIYTRARHVPFPFVSSVSSLEPDFSHLIVILLQPHTPIIGLDVTMSFATYPCAPTPVQPQIPTSTQTKPDSVLFQGDVPPPVQRQIVEFSDFHLKDVDFARPTGQRLVLKEASVFERPEDAKLQSRLVYEVIVAQGASFARGTWHLALGTWQGWVRRKPPAACISARIVADHPPIHRRYDKPPRDAARRVRRVPRRRVSPFFSMSPGARH